MSRATEILVIEDDPTMQRLIESVLKSATLGEFFVRRAGTLEEGIKATMSVTPDLMLVDLDLPDAKELESVRALLALAPKAALVVLTASADEKLGVEAIRLGAQDWIQKRSGLEYLLPRAITFAVERQRRRVSLMTRIEGLKETPEG